jgi:hypothetical protein
MQQNFRTPIDGFGNIHKRKAGTRRPLRRHEWAILHQLQLAESPQMSPSSLRSRYRRSGIRFSLSNPPSIHIHQMTNYVLPLGRYYITIQEASPSLPYLLYTTPIPPKLHSIIPSILTSHNFITREAVGSSSAPAVPGTSPQSSHYPP